MKTAQRIALCAAALFAISTAAQANVTYHVESLNANTAGGGEVIVAVDLTCKGRDQNFVVQTDADQRIIYRGCAYREGSYVVIHWNDGAVVSYALNQFRSSNSDITF